MTKRRFFIKQLGVGSAGFGLMATIPGCVQETKEVSKDSDGPFELLRASPESQGISSSSIVNFLKALEETGQDYHSLMILRHGNVITECWWTPYSPDLKQQLYSLSKSFTSTAIGLAQEEGLLSVEDTVISFFPDELPEKVSDNLAAMKVKHLLMMSVGHAKDSIRIIEKTEGMTWSKHFLSLPVEFEPGTKFLYNSGASYMLCAIIQKVTNGGTAHDFLKPRLFEPLNITGSTWTTSPDGVNMGASHLRLKTEDLAKFGQLYLQKGKWNGKQILPATWVEAATSKQIANGDNNHSWGYGYGYQFWLNPPGGFRADGAFGQFSFVFPDKDAVVVLTGESFNTGDTMQAVWDHLYPHFLDVPSITENSKASGELIEAIRACSYDPPQFQVESSKESFISGKVYVFPDNVHQVMGIQFDFENEQCVVTIKQDGRDDKIVCAKNQWYIGDNYKVSDHALFSTLRIDFDSVVAASATWQDESTLILTWRHLETTHTDTLTCVFDGDEVVINFRNSINGQPKDEDQRNALVGKYK